ncbi:MAG: D-glycero-beta-D-manno-heptose-7-phosphate kinase, partial [Bdellovibrionales bacterium]|nr:D-glycero-beta-D-manno-heptose-7-phosphate kinase [Bdellovibrionales bacterium]
MISTKDNLLEALNSFGNLTIAVVGDLILDKYVWGDVERISPEAPVPIVKVDKVEYRLGGAANVVMNLCKLGVKAELCAVVGDDEESKTAKMLLAKVSAPTSGLVIDPSRPTSVKTRIIARRQQMIRVDSESTIA